MRAMPGASGRSGAGRVDLVSGLPSGGHSGWRVLGGRVTGPAAQGSSARGAARRTGRRVAVAPGPRAGRGPPHGRRFAGETKGDGTPGIGVPNFPAASPDGHETARSPEPGLHEIAQQHCPARRCSRDVRPRPGASNLQQRVDDLLAAHRAAFRREPSYATAVSVGKRQLTVTPICTGLSSATEDRCTHRRTSHARRHRRSRPQRPRSRCLWWPQSSRLPPRGAPRNRFPNC